MQCYSDGILYHLKLHQSKKNLPHLLMMHGFMGMGNAFDHLIKPLSEFCNPITIDLAGHGNTKTPVDVDLFKTDRQVYQMKTILSRLSFDRLFAYGYSMGGRLLFQMVGNYPEFFHGVIIESSHCGIQDETVKTKRIKTDEQRAVAILSDYSLFVDQWMELPLFEHASPDQKETYSSLMKQQNPKLMAASLRGFGSGVMPNVCEKLQNINLPLYLVAGKLDRKYVDILSGLEKKIPGSALSIFDDAAHRVHADQPDELIKIIQSIIKSHHA